MLYYCLLINLFTCHRQLIDSIASLSCCSTMLIALATVIYSGVEDGVEDSMEDSVEG